MPGHIVSHFDPMSHGQSQISTSTQLEDDLRYPAALAMSSIGLPWHSFMVYRRKALVLVDMRLLEKFGR